LSFVTYLGIAILAIISSLILLRIFRKQELEKLKQALIEKKEEILHAANSFHSIINSDSYISKNEYSNWQTKWNHLRLITQKYAKSNLTTEFDEELKELESAFENGYSLIRDKNEKIIQLELEVYKEFFDNIMNEPLTENQRRAIVTDEKHNLVVAGAGAGKTFTLIGKAAYLLRKGLASPEEILLLAFARKIRRELDERVKTIGNQASELTIRTFHSLGLKIIGEVEGKIPSVSELSRDRTKLRRTIQEYIDKKQENQDFLDKLNKYFAFYKTPYKSEFDFKSKGQYIEFLRNNHVRSLNGELVKSLEECEIANFLYMNGIDYEYERDYEVDYASKIHRQYRPDFYLPKYHTYIEHFGLDRNNHTAPFIDRNEYLAEMKWKRRVHRENKTILVETYSWEKFEGILLEELERKLVAQGVKMNKIPPGQMFSKLKEMGLVSPFARLLTTFLNLFKSSRKSLPELLQLSKGFPDPKRCKVFLEIFSDIYQDYEESLGEEIDFDDMINRAEKFVTDHSYHSNFKYILIDEFQDISYNRFKLLKSLVDQNPSSKLFCVGDDWQSIYRFNGGDVSIMTDFEHRFNPHERLILSKTFRFDRKLCDFSNIFILRNPNQIKKKLTSDRDKLGPAITLYWSDVYEDTIVEILSRIKADGKRRERVFIIGRYNHQRPINIPQLRKLYPKLRISFTTAHSSKGKEADYVIVIGLTSQGYAFPSQIADDPVLDLVLAEKEDEPNAEERRLFYVAVTRAKKHVYLIASKEDPSLFAHEIKDGDYEVEIKGDTRESAVSCSWCKTGTIMLRHGKLGEFYLCSNYPYCKYKPRMCPNCDEGFLIDYPDSNDEPMQYICSNKSCSFKSAKCPGCNDGYLIERSGRHSDFFGCSNYPTCRYTRPLSQQQ